jgi:hypothetical protein
MVRKTLHLLDTFMSSMINLSVAILWLWLVWLFAIFSSLHIVRIKQVLNAGMLSDVLMPEDKQQIVDFLESNMDSMREISLRMVKKLADLMLMSPDNWKELASMTCMKNS